MTAQKRWLAPANGLAAMALQGGVAAAGAGHNAALMNQRLLLNHLPV